MRTSDLQPILFTGTIEEWRATLDWLEAHDEDLPRPFASLGLTLQYVLGREGYRREHRFSINVERKRERSSNRFRRRWGLGRS